MVEGDFADGAGFVRLAAVGRPQDVPALTTHSAVSRLAPTIHATRWILNRRTRLAYSRAAARSSLSSVRTVAGTDGVCASSSFLVVSVGTRNHLLLSPA